MGQIDDRFNPGALVTSLDVLFSWARRSSLWWLQFGLACCGMEMVAASMSRFDLAERFGMWFRPTPRQADLMFVAGTVTKKMAPFVRQLYDQMPEPKWVIAMGSCACAGGPFDTYAVVQGVDQVLPVDIYVPGCPPTPEALYYGVLMLQHRVIGHESMTRQYGPAAAERWRAAERDVARQGSRQERISQMRPVPTLPAAPFHTSPSAVAFGAGWPASPTRTMVGNSPHERRRVVP